MFYERFMELCQKNSIAPTKAVEDIGLNKANATFWKRGSLPKTETLQKLADYFAVSVDYLLGKSDTDEEGRPAFSDSDLMYALWGGASEITREDLEEVRRFAAYIKARRQELTKDTE